MFTVTRTLLLAALASMASAHMSMVDPAPLTGKDNPKSPEGSINYSLTSPMTGSEMFPCNVNNFPEFVKGPGAEAVATWAAGSKQHFTISEGAVHGGGSCQAVLSEDSGSTWKVIEEYIGNCPVAGKPFEFTVPSEAKAQKNTLFGWTWFNKVGNREMYMNCAAIEITGGGSGLSGLPDMFVANVPGVSDCVTDEGVDIDFKTDKCATGGSSGSGSGSDSGSTPAESGAAPSAPVESGAAPSAPAESGAAPSAPVESGAAPSAPVESGAAPSAAPSAPAYSAPAGSSAVVDAPAPTGTGNSAPVVVAPTPAPSTAAPPAAESSAPAAGSPAQSYDNGMWNADKYGYKPAAATAAAAGTYKRALRRHARDLSAHRH